MVLIESVTLDSHETSIAVGGVVTEMDKYE